MLLTLLDFLYDIRHTSVKHIQTKTGLKMNSKLDTTLDIVGCTTKEINSFFENWHEHTELTRLETIRALRVSGHLSTKYKSECCEDFKCPLFGFTLIKPCGLMTCQYHTPVTVNPVQVQLAHGHAVHA